ncbi:helix-turn-helix domain-containing protein [Neobacillus sp. FSL H8-0543]|uniref:helix-turn-helix domain-containing protein n=1 Tax=Neobacillus sp. FSL H8-0543 TaxID=2954672 RepID=UPI003158D15C
MQNIEIIMLYCLKQLNGERTIYSIYHLLNGKKSSQTIQDAHLFSLKNYFRILEPLTRDSFDIVFKRLLDKNWVEPIGDQIYRLSSSGLVNLQKFPPPKYINGWKYHHISTVVWERLSLLTQVTSNLTFQETRYIPIQKNKEVHRWLKRVLKEYPLPREAWGNTLFTELVDCFNEEKDINPSVLVFRLTGYQQIGLTSLQSSKKLAMDPINYHLEFLNILHFIIHMIESDTGRYKLLSTLLADLMEHSILTLSARKTWELLNQGFTIEQISANRNLKNSTIEDHLVEFALNIKEFSIDPYVEKDIQEKVMQISRQGATRQLKLIRNKLPTASYFKIRLVLAKNGDQS